VVTLPVETVVKDVGLSVVTLVLTELTGGAGSVAVGEVGIGERDETLVDALLVLGRDDVVGLLVGCVDREDCVKDWLEPEMVEERDVTLLLTEVDSVVCVDELERVGDLIELGEVLDDRLDTLVLTEL